MFNTAPLSCGVRFGVVFVEGTSGTDLEIGRIFCGDLSNKLGPLSSPILLRLTELRLRFNSCLSSGFTGYNFDFLKGLELGAVFTAGIAEAILCLSWTS